MSEKVVLEKRTYSIPEAAELLGVSRSFAYKAVHDGSLPTIPIRGRMLVSKLVLDRMLNGERQL